MRSLFASSALLTNVRIGSSSSEQVHFCKICKSNQYFHIELAKRNKYGIVIFLLFAMLPSPSFLLCLQSFNKFNLLVSSCPFSFAHFQPVNLYVILFLYVIIYSHNKLYGIINIYTVSSPLFRSATPYESSTLTVSFEEYSLFSVSMEYQ